jgi:hypothetical protein
MGAVITNYFRPPSPAAPAQLRRDGGKPSGEADGTEEETDIMIGSAINSPFGLLNPLKYRPLIALC